ncbi:MAG TPA: hypothetical protein VLA43_07320, partial [Longimicrobiales bacterium]|nr:hypothetical protein [Longimicrobiales bacterium]
MRASALLLLAALCAAPCAAAASGTTVPEDGSALEHARARLEQDLEALRAFRPSYPFWRNVFMVSDGAVLYASAVDGRLLARFPARGDWRKGATWEDPSLAHVLDGATLDRNVSRRRDQVAA